MQWVNYEDSHAKIESMCSILNAALSHHCEELLH